MTQIFIQKRMNSYRQVAPFWTRCMIHSRRYLEEMHLLTNEAVHAYILTRFITLDVSHEMRVVYHEQGFEY